eukprot:TRINITY_DN1984_c0_g1_i1.p2 TRINITY_DN1984_c0_g1~~TRINITY_DN1984_c0_g1_i1.p2  ORF type:complete len:51 (-),score=4.23 TRINITY_DN1984_c0_g1_i1:717-869(-)
MRIKHPCEHANWQATDACVGIKSKLSKGTVWGTRHIQSLQLPTSSTYKKT